MASENKPRYERIGFTVLAAVAAVAAALVYIGGYGGRKTEILAETYYDNPVSGLAPGSAVNFRGVKVGEVRDIMLAGLRDSDTLAAADAQRVRILIAFDLRKLGLRGETDKDKTERILNAEIARGLRATVVSSGITGLSRVELNILEDAPPAAQIAWKPRHPLIPPAPSLMDSLSDTATRVMNQVNKTDFAAVWGNVQSAAESAARLAASADEIIETQKAALDSIMKNADEAVLRLEDFSRRIGDDPSLLLRPSDPEELPETR